jgi:hypothetical protein
LLGIKVTIIRYISDEPQPGVVECELKDAHGIRLSIIEKTACVSADHLSAHSTYPQQRLVACEAIGRSRDATGREVIRIGTDSLLVVDSVEGATQLEVLPDSLVEW